VSPRCPFQDSAMANSDTKTQPWHANKHRWTRPLEQIPTRPGIEFLQDGPELLSERGRRVFNPHRHFREHLPFTRPSRSSSRNCCVSIFCEIRGMLCRRTLNRNGCSLSISHHRITGFHRPPISTSNSSMGHLLAIRLALVLSFCDQVSIWCPVLSP
jgi:hypothetical protein